MLGSNGKIVGTLQSGALLESSGNLAGKEIGGNLSRNLIKKKNMLEFNGNRKESDENQ